MSIRPNEARFKNRVSRISARDVIPGDFVMVDIGPDRNPLTGFYSKVVKVIDTGDHVTLITTDSDRICRRGDRLAYLRRSKR